MQLATVRGGRYMNRRFDIEDGTVHIHQQGGKPEILLHIRDGQIAQIKDIKYTGRYLSGTTITTVERDRSQADKASLIRTVNRYHGGSSLPIEGVFFEVRGLKIGNHSGVLRQWSKGSRFVREDFVYENGQTAYIWTRRRKRFRLYRPRGSLWMEVTARIRGPWKRSTHFFEKVNGILDNIADETHAWSYQPEYEIRMYNRGAKPYGYGRVSNHQRTGVWRHGRARYYYLMGVAVSRHIFQAGPDELDPRKILRTENVQLRAALMKKIGPERLLKKLPFTVCDVNGDNQLLKTELKDVLSGSSQSAATLDPRNRFDDRIAIAMLRCPSTGQLFYLRVPPGVNKAEHARQWLCGIDIEQVEEEYVRERWRPLANERTGQLTPTQQTMLDAELEQARSRTQLEFVGEA